MCSKSRYYGCILGLAVGDALGGAFELEPVAQRKKINDMSDNQTHYGVLPGIWTDETSMTLLLLESLVQHDYDQVQQLKNLQRWLDTGHLAATGNCDDIAGPILKALHSYRQELSTRPMDSDNSSLVRTAAAVLYQPNESMGYIVKLAGKCSQTTHSSDLVADSCRYLAALTKLALDGRTKQELMNHQVGPEYQTEMQTLANNKPYLLNQVEQLNGTHQVMSTLRTALYCFFKTDNFREGALMAVKNSQDSDGVGAVYGQLAGAFYGLEQVPWLENLVQTPMILEVVDQAWDNITDYQDMNDTHTGDTVVTHGFSQVQTSEAEELHEHVPPPQVQTSELHVQVPPSQDEYEEFDLDLPQQAPDVSAAQQPAAGQPLIIKL